MKREAEDEHRLLTSLSHHRILTIAYEHYFAGEDSILATNRRVFGLHYDYVLATAWASRAPLVSPPPLQSLQES